MALPTPKVPTYKTTLPQSGKVVTYRTFLVKESKIIQLAMTSDDIGEIVQAMRQVVRLCTMDSVDVDKLSMVDLNWLMIKIRTVSKGSNVDLAMKCKNKLEDRVCGYVNEISVSLDDLVVSGEIPDNNIPLYDDVGIVMTPPSLDLMTILNKNESESESIMKIVIGSIDYIYEGDQIYTSSDVTQEEVVEFLDSLTPEQLEPLLLYIKNQPKLSITVDYKCGGCGIEHKIEVDNITDFLD